MKHTKLVMLGVLTSSLYASGFYGGVDMGAAFINAKSNGITKTEQKMQGDTTWTPVTDKTFNNRKTKLKFMPGIFIGRKINPEASGGVELSFNAMFGKYSNKFATAGNDYYLKLRERFSGTIKGFLSHRLRNIELYATAGLKLNT
ncbi:MAG: hypothetical protein IJ481_02235 [Alphaproteobacteria bacterium]|nr:hypothetical protein [Alphaproteobacteria bacterium]